MNYKKLTNGFVRGRVKDSRRISDTDYETKTRILVEMADEFQDEIMEFVPTLNAKDVKSSAGWLWLRATPKVTNFIKSTFPREYFTKNVIYETGTGWYCIKYGNFWSDDNPYKETDFTKICKGEISDSRRVKDGGDMFSENIKKQYNDAKLAFESVFNEGSLNPKGYSDLKLEIEQNYTYKIYKFEHPDISSIVNANHSCGSQRIDSLVMDIYETALDYVLSENKGISNEEADSLAWDLIVNDYGYYIQYKTVLGIAQDHGSGVIEIEFYINLESRDGRSAHRQKVFWKVLGLDYLTGIKRNAQEIVDKINSINFGSEKIEYGSSRNVSDSRRVKDFDSRRVSDGAQYDDVESQEEYDYCKQTAEEIDNWLEYENGVPYNEVCAELESRGFVLSKRHGRGDVEQIWQVENNLTNAGLYLRVVKNKTIAKHCDFAFNIYLFDEDEWKMYSL